MDEWQASATYISKTRGERAEEKPKSADNNTDQGPLSLQRRFSSRALLLHSLQNCITAMNDHDGQETLNHHVLFLTSAGQMEGYFVGPDDREWTDQVVSSIHQSNINLIRQLEDGEPLNLLGSAAYVILRDVTLRPWAAPRQRMQFPRLCLFVDDIEGFTVL